MSQPKKPITTRGDYFRDETNEWFQDNLLGHEKDDSPLTKGAKTVGSWIQQPLTDSFWHLGEVGNWATGGDNRDPRARTGNLEQDSYNPAPQNLGGKALDVGLTFGTGGVHGGVGKNKGLPMIKSLWNKIVGKGGKSKPKAKKPSGKEPAKDLDNPAGDPKKKGIGNW